MALEQQTAISGSPVRPGFGARPTPLHSSPDTAPPPPLPPRPHMHRRLAVFAERELRGGGDGALWRTVLSRGPPPPPRLGQCEGERGGVRRRRHVDGTAMEVGLRE